MSVREVFNDRDFDVPAEFGDDVVNAAVFGISDFGIGKFPENDTFNPLKTGTQSQLLEHEVNFVGFFSHVFNQQNRVGEIGIKRRTAKIAKQAQTAAEKNAFSLTADNGLTAAKIKFSAADNGAQRFVDKAVNVSVFEIVFERETGAGYGFCPGVKAELQGR